MVKMKRLHKENQKKVEQKNVVSKNVSNTECVNEILPSNRTFN